MRIDVQTHHIPANYAKALEARRDFPRMERGPEVSWAFGGPDEKLPFRAPILDLALKVEEMDAEGVDLSLLSVNIPGPDLAPDPKDADELARIANDGIAEAAARHPGRFRGVASLGYGDVDASCRELERCLDELGCVALQVFAYIGGRRNIDAPEFEPVWALLAERGAPLVLHPGPSPSGPAYRDHWLGPLVGFMFDECLAALRLILGGTMERHPKLRVLLPHGGASLPYFIGRVDSLSARYLADRENIPHPPSHYFARFHTDAVAHSKTALAFALREMGVGRMMFATDAPWVPMRRHVDLVEELGLPPADAERVWSGNAKAFFGL